MDIVKTLESNKAGIEKKAEQVNQQRQKLKTELAQNTAELNCLQGEYRIVEKLLAEFKDV